MKKKQALLQENEFLVDLTFNNIPVSLLSEFTEKIVRPYNGNLNAVIQDLLIKALAEQDLVLSLLRMLEERRLNFWVELFLLIGLL